MRYFFSSIRLDEKPGHDYVGFWQDGAKNGELVLEKGTGRTLIDLMGLHANLIVINGKASHHDSP